MKTNMIYMTPSSVRQEEHLGTASIAGYLEAKGMDVSLTMVYFDIDNPNIEEMYKNIEKADLYGFPLFNTNAEQAYKLITLIKNNNPDSKIFVGGRLATDAADLVFRDCQDIDYIILGDGEEPVYDIIKTLEKKEDVNRLTSVLVKGEDKINKIPHVCDVKELPWVSRKYLEQLNKEGYGTARITTSRGCVANCSFCSQNSYGNAWQGRNMRDVFDEIVYIYNKYGIRSFAFNDGSFEDPGILGKRRIREFCILAESYPVKFHYWCFLRADTFTENDIELIQLMRKVGFTEIFIGVESHSNNDLKIFNKRANQKDNLRSMRLFEENNFNVLLGFIIFNPYSTTESLKENYLFLSSIYNWRPHAFVGKVALYYNTSLHRRCEKDDLLKPEFSYLNPMEYNFQNEEVSKIWEFIDKYLANSIVCTQYDFDLFFYNNFYYSLMSVFPNEMSEYNLRHKNIMNKIANEQIAYYHIIYIERDFEKAKKMLNSFIDNMGNLIHDMNSLKLSIILKKQFREYLRITLKNPENKSNKSIISN